ncbi:MAG: hypothetical protein P1Q69_15030 [Candidatus Thorarchaeota archaeon]|nr:hypothetical protein [Candidatus Thorarchaeota archaeon]
MSFSNEQLALGRQRLSVRLRWHKQWEHLMRLSSTRYDEYCERKRKKHGHWVKELWDDKEPKEVDAWSLFVSNLGLARDMTAVMDLL